MSLVVLTDRSRIKTTETCPRLRWYEYHAEGRGLQLGSSVPIDVGSCVHKGIETFLKPFTGLMVSDPEEYQLELLDDMLEAAHEDEAFARLTEAEDRDTVDALLRTWWAIGLPQLAGWRVVEVEREETFDYSVSCLRCVRGTLQPNDLRFERGPYMPTTCPACKGTGKEAVVKMMSRLDLLAEATPGVTLNGLPVAPGIYVWNWKTAKRCDERWKTGWDFDMQTLTECLGVEQRLGQRITGVVIVGLQKENHPLVGTFRNKETGETTSRFEWACEEGHPFRYAKGGFCPGGVKHRLGKEWERTRVADQGVLLERMALEGYTPLREWVTTVGPITRPSDAEIAEWCEENLPFEAEYAKAHPPGVLTRPEESVMRRVFPRRTSNCLWQGGRRCEAFSYCRGGAPLDDLTLRRPNHEIERDLCGE